MFYLMIGKKAWSLNPKHNLNVGVDFPPELDQKLAFFLAYIYLSCCNTMKIN